MSNSLEVIHSSFLPLLLAYVVEHELEIFAWSSEIDLILSTIILVVQYLWDFLVYENISVDDVEHTLYLIKFSNRIDKSQRIEVIDAANLFNNKTSFD